MEHFPKLGQRIISIHSLVKRETQKRARQCCSLKISIHSLVKRETRCFDCFCGRNHNFNPLPRKEGDIEGLAPLAEKIGISIHSLVKRETHLLQKNYTGSESISIHSLVKRETQAAWGQINSAIISIHSLVKRETANTKIRGNIISDFNPLPRKEGDIVRQKNRQRKKQFQSTPS